MAKDRDFKYKKKKFCENCRIPMNPKMCIKEGEKRYKCPKCGAESD